ncbi:hypothetical protein E2C01_063864 [Portunus trituberculatus]|uniref:Uncharacterized protein n=1 Tax=Portunus trituberculatus TaxID=210409 RepID=A0A5B7HM87_PORTR|nr:hypothetical protein [Portunus trituberculatus]
MLIPLGRSAISDVANHISSSVVQNATLGNHCPSLTVSFEPRSSGSAAQRSQRRFKMAYNKARRLVSLDSASNTCASWAAVSLQT